MIVKILFLLTCVFCTIDTRLFVYPSLSSSLLMETGLLAIAFLRFLRDIITFSGTLLPAGTWASRPRYMVYTLNPSVASTAVTVVRMRFIHTDHLFFVSGVMVFSFLNQINTKLLKKTPSLSRFRRGLAENAENAEIFVGQRPFRLRRGISPASYGHYDRSSAS